MSNVADIDAHRPHISLPTLDGNAHVFPVALIEDIVAGRTSIDALDGRDIILRTILSNWLKGLEQ